MRFSKSSGSSPTENLKFVRFSCFLGCFSSQILQENEFIQFIKHQHLDFFVHRPKVLDAIEWKIFVSSLSSTCNSKNFCFMFSRIQQLRLCLLCHFAKCHLSHIYKEQVYWCQIAECQEFQFCFWFLIRNFVILVFLVLRTINNLYV